MAKKGPEIRMSQGAAVAVVAIVVLAIIGVNAGWFGAKEAPVVEPTETPTGVPLTVVPAIEKTKIYVSTFDMADYEGEGQKNRVAGTADLIKSGNVLETVNTSTSTGVASTAEFNGGDMVTVLGDATNYYAYSEAANIEETLQPFEVGIKAAATPTVEILDDKKDNLTSMTITLDTNDVSKTHYVSVERPGDDTWYQLCGIGADYDDEQIDLRVKDKSGSFVEGENDLDETYDYLDGVGVDFVWEFDEPIKNFDEEEIAFVVGTAKDVDPSTTLLLYVFDCEHNLQNGEIVYSNEDSADADVGLANVMRNITIG